MKYAELSQHLHELRASRTGRAIGRGMTLAEVWHGAIESSKTDVSSIRYFEAEFPRPVDGLFARLHSDDETVLAAVFVRKSLEKHWKEFVAIKELMHCWSPTHTWIGTPSAAKGLVSALTRKDGRYTPNVAADSAAVSAAAEVILPHRTVERHLAEGHDFQQIAAMHGLHPEVVEMICRHDILHARKNGSLSDGDLG